MARVTPGRKAEYVSTCTGNVESGFFGGSFLIASVKEKKKKLSPETVDKGEGVEV